MKDILGQIVESKRLELSYKMGELSLEALRERAMAAPVSGRSLGRALEASYSGIIAEFKRKSPSKGWIREGADPSEVVCEYAASGAAAVSVLTDGPYFGGSLGFLSQVRPLVDVPLLRKDFIISEYQLLEARLAGADAVLLIAACLEKMAFDELLEKAHSLGLEVLLEVHSEGELDYVCPGVDLVGVNNRNLGTFVTDVRNSFNLAGALRERLSSFVRVPMLVSESGISDPRTVRSLRSEGFRGFLMGENFMRAEDPGAALREFVSEVV